MSDIIYTFVPGEPVLYEPRPGVIEVMNFGMYWPVTNRVSISAGASLEETCFSYYMPLDKFLSLNPKSQYHDLRVRVMRSATATRPAYEEGGWKVSEFSQNFQEVRVESSAGVKIIRLDEFLTLNKDLAHLFVIRDKTQYIDWHIRNIRKIG